MTTISFASFISQAAATGQAFAQDSLTNTMSNRARNTTAKGKAYGKVAVSYVVNGSIAVYDAAKRFLTSKLGKVAIKATAATAALYVGATVTATTVGAAFVGYAVYGLGAVGISILKGERKTPLEHTLAVGEGVLYVAGITVGYLLLSPIIVGALVNAFVWSMNAVVSLVNALLALWFNFGALIVG